MLKQVLKQNASKTEAKSKQSQRQIQIRASRLFVFGPKMEIFIISSRYVTRGSCDGMMAADAAQGWAA